MALEVQMEINGNKGAFYIEVDKVRQAESTFSMAGESLIIIDHTDVQDALRGQGAGNLLVAAAVEWAREQNKMILPLCPFANSLFHKTEAYADVWKR
jgi:predicted GNAT family acetyltransferase